MIKKLLGIVVLSLFLSINIFADEVCLNPNIFTGYDKPIHPERPDSESLLIWYPQMKPYKPPCVWNQTPCSQIDYDTYVAGVNAYNMMLSEFSGHYNRYVKDLRKYLDDINNYVACDLKYINRQIEIKKNSPY